MVTYDWKAKIGTHLAALFVGVGLAYNGCHRNQDKIASQQTQPAVVTQYTHIPLNVKVQEAKDVEVVNGSIYQTKRDNNGVQSQVNRLEVIADIDPSKGNVSLRLNSEPHLVRKN